MESFQTDVMFYGHIIALEEYILSLGIFGVQFQQDSFEIWHFLDKPLPGQNFSEFLVE